MPFRPCRADHCHQLCWRATACNGRRHRRHSWHLRQCGFCKLQNPKEARESESHSLRHISSYLSDIYTNSAISSVNAASASDEIRPSLLLEALNGLILYREFGAPRGTRLLARGLLTHTSIRLCERCDVGRVLTSPRCARRSPASSSRHSACSPPISARCCRGSCPGPRTE